MASSFVRSFLGALCAVLVMNAPAFAQICGDADDDGQVSVTDGVQALRAAATLSNTCTPARCDVDGNGSISVTDGVNILRKAASLPISESCPNTETQVEDLLQSTLGIFGQVTSIISVAGAQIAEIFACDNEDGLLTVDDETGEFEFLNCQLGPIVFDGTLSPDSGGTVFFDISFTDLETDQFFSLFGDLGFRSTQTGGIIAGSLDVSFEDLGELSVVFEDVETDVDDNFVGGSLLFDASSAGIDGVVAIRVGFAPSPVVPVSVFLDDQRTLDFEYDILAGVLTPVSN